MLCVNRLSPLPMSKYCHFFFSVGGGEEAEKDDHWVRNFWYRFSHINKCLLYLNQCDSLSRDGGCHGGDFFTRYWPHFMRSDLLPITSFTPCSTLTREGERDRSPPQAWIRTEQEKTRVLKWMRNVATSSCSCLKGSAAIHNVTAVARVSPFWSRTDRVWY